MDSRLSLEKVRDNGALALEPAPLSRTSEDADFSNRFGPYKRLHRLVRGRYHLLLPCILIALAAGAVFGWRRNQPIYRSEGIIQVNNSLPQVIAQTDQNEPLGMFEEFVQSQVLLMSSRGVVAQTLNDPDFRAALGNRHDMNVDTFVANLVVEQPPRTQVIDITFTDRDPTVATKAVQALINTFMAVSGKSGDVEEEKRIAVLDERKTKLTQQIDTMKQQLTQVQTPSVMIIATQDEMMKSLLQQESALENELDQYIASGFGDSRPEVRGARLRLADLHQKIEAYQKDVMAMQAAAAATPESDRHISVLPSFSKYMEDLDNLRKERDQVQQRIDTLQTEASLGAERFRILSNGDTPVTPYADHRPRAAAMYGIAAAIIPLFGFMLLGIANQRFHFSEDAADASTNAPLLGVLPELPTGEGYSDLPRIAAYCVHNLRIRLQLLPGKRGDRVYMITSATAGEGKTSLTLALSFSFASAGKRVLMIDTDLVGRGLTRRLKCEGKQGLLESVTGAGLTPVQHVMKNVALLPAGRVANLGREVSLPIDALSDLIESARSRFDLILIDTGPVVASLQTPMIAQVADHVILTISQGLQQALCRRSMQILRTAGIRISGVVFNRARAKDYRRWIGGDKYYASSASSEWNAIDPEQQPEFGPLAGSIADGELTSVNGQH
jgi:Mrp family chromosome partitioning ATPase/capsular polysaccharide biosynthesis protein